MSKNILFFVILIALVIGGGYLYSSNNAETKMVERESISDKVETQVVVNKDVKSTASGKYLPFTDGVLERSRESRRILFFYASWCPTCIPANADFEKNVTMLPSDITVIRVNYNDPDTDAEEKTLSIKYGITYQHTYVQIDQAGNELVKWNGGSLKELLAKIK